MKRCLGLFASAGLVLALALTGFTPLQADPEDAVVDVQRVREAIEEADELWTGLDARRAEVPQRAREDFDDLMDEAGSDLRGAKRRNASGDAQGALEHAESSLDQLYAAQRLIPRKQGGSR